MTIATSGRRSVLSPRRAASPRWRCASSSSSRHVDAEEEPDERQDDAGAPGSGASGLSARRRERGASRGGGMSRGAEARRRAFGGESTRTRSRGGVRRDATARVEARERASLPEHAITRGAPGSRVRPVSATRAGWATSLMASPASSSQALTRVLERRARPRRDASRAPRRARGGAAPLPGTSNFSTAFASITGRRRGRRSRAGRPPRRTCARARGRRERGVGRAPSRRRSIPRFARNGGRASAYSSSGVSRGVFEVLVVDRRGTSSASNFPSPLAALLPGERLDRARRARRPPGRRATSRSARGS